MVTLAAPRLHAQQILLHPRVYNDVPAATLTSSSTATSVSFGEQNVSAASGFANRDDWHVSTDGASDKLFGASDYFDVSADVTLTGSPISPRKEAGLRINGGGCGDGLLIVDTDAHEVVAFTSGGSYMPFYDFRANGVSDFNSGDKVHLRLQYLNQSGVNGFIYTANGVTSPFLAAGGSGICSGSTVGGYLQVQNDSGTPTNSGSASFDNIAISIAGSSAGPPLTDDQLLDQTEAQACKYAVAFAPHTAANATFPYGRTMVSDSSTSGSLCSVGGTGMALVSLAILANRYGTTPNWTVTTATARAEADAILDAVLNMQSTSASFSGLPYHFVQPGAGGTFVAASGSEVSTVDGAYLIAGALAAGQYFGGEVRAKALQISANVHWSNFLENAGGSERFALAWKPSNGNGYTVPSAGGGYLTSGTWDRPTDEILITTLTALGVEPGNANFLKTMYSWPRVARSYHGSNGTTYTCYNSYFGSLFTYSQAHALVPFELLGKDHPSDVGASGPAVDWYANSVQGTLADRQFCADHAAGQTPPDGYATHAAFGPDSWGLTVCYDPSDLSNYLGLLGAPPREYNNGAPETQGVIAPYGPISCINILRTAPTEALTANPAFTDLRNLYNTRYSTLWGAYGPKDAYNDAGQAANIYLAIDAELEAMAIEDYRTGLPSQWWSTSPPNANAIATVYHKGLAPGDLDLDGTITVSDAAIALQIAGGLQTPTPAQRYNADVSPTGGDGQITLADAVAIARMAN